MRSSTVEIMIMCTPADAPTNPSTNPPRDRGAGEVEAVEVVDVVDVIEGVGAGDLGSAGDAMTATAELAVAAAAEPAADPVRVLVVDDQAPFRAAARAVIDRVKGFTLAAEATSGEAAVEMAAQHRPELVLMDINMGAMDGTEATRIITAAQPATVVILVSTYAVDDLPASARTCGAAAYLNKDELSPRTVRHLWEAGGDPEWRTGAHRNGA